MRLGYSIILIQYQEKEINSHGLNQMRLMGSKAVLKNFTKRRVLT